MSAFQQQKQEFLISSSHLCEDVSALMHLDLLERILIQAVLEHKLQTEQNGK
jgi:hypothetical protein